MKQIIILLVLLLCPAVASGATVYAKTISGTVYYESGASACADVTNGDTSGDLEAALTAAGASGILNICEETLGTSTTYSGAELDSADNLDTVADGATINGIGTVILDGSGFADHTLSFTHDTTINDIELIGSPSGTYNLCMGATKTVTVNDCIIRDGDRGIIANNGCTLTINRTKISGHNSENYFMRVNNANDVVTLNYCRIEDNEEGARLTGTLNVNNSLFVGNDERAIWTNDATGTAVIKNSLFVSNAVGSPAVPILQNDAGGSITASYSLIQPNPRDPENVNWTNLTDGGNNLYINQRFRINRRPSLITLMIDDYNNLADFQAMATLAEVKGWGAAIALNGTHTVTGGDWTTLSSLVDRGHEVSAHGRRHYDLTNLNAFDMQYTGDASTALRTISSNTLTITLAGDQTDGSTNLSYDLTSASYDLISEVVSAIEAETGYTAAKVSPSDGNVLSITLEDVTNEDVKTASVNVNYDETRMFDEEIAGSVADIEANISGYTVKTFVCPGNSTNEAIQDYVKGLGLTASRTGNFGANDMSNYEIFGVSGWNIDSSFGSGATLERNISAFIEFLGYMSGATVLYSHGSDETSEANWSTVIDAVADSNIQVSTFSELATYITTNGVDADSDGERWTRTFVDADNYNLRASSPARNTGTPNGSTPYSTATTDLNGRVITDSSGDALPPYGRLDMGAYEYWQGVGAIY